VTMAAIAIGASVAVSVAGSVMSAQASAQGAENAQATMQGGISRLSAFRDALRKENADYQTWQKDVTRQAVNDVSGPAQQTQGYLDAQRRMMAMQAATGSVRSGAAEMGMADLASREQDAEFNRRQAVAQMLQAQTGHSDSLIASTYADEANLLGKKADAQQQEANAKAAGISSSAGAISSGLSSAGGAAMGGYSGMAGGMTSSMGSSPDMSINTGGGFDTRKLGVGGAYYGSGALGGYTGGV